MHATPASFALALLLAGPPARADDAPARPAPPPAARVDALVEVERGLQLELPSVMREIVLHPGADTPATSSPPLLPPTPRSTWYGWQTLAVDVASFGLVALSFTRFETSSSGGTDTLPWALLSGGVGTFVLGGPIIHAVHGEWAWGDLGLRLGVPLFAALVGYGIASTQVTSLPACNAPPPGWQGLGCALEQVHNDGVRLEGALIGAGTGALAASVLDAVVLARAPVATPPSERHPSLTWSPTVAIRAEGGASAGVVGRF